MLRGSQTALRPIVRLTTRVFFSIRRSNPAVKEVPWCLFIGHAGLYAKLSANYCATGPETLASYGFVRIRSTARSKVVLIR